MSKMSLTTVLAATFGVLAITGFATAAQMKAATSTARSASINCTIPNNVSCKITSAKGLKAVLIKAGVAQDYVALVNKTYNGCPKQVTVTWDSAFQMGSKQITECTSMGLKN